MMLVFLNNHFIKSADPDQTFLDQSYIDLHVYFLPFLFLCISTPPKFFCHLVQREATFVNTHLLSSNTSPSKIESTLKGKNLLLQEQILSFKS